MEINSKQFSIAAFALMAVMLFICASPATAFVNVNTEQSIDATMLLAQVNTVISDGPSMIQYSQANFWIGGYGDYESLDKKDPPKKKKRYIMPWWWPIFW